MASSGSSSSEIAPTNKGKPARLGAEQHRFESWLYIFLPMLGGGLLLVILLALALLLPMRAQVSLVADFMLIIFVLCPLVICTFPLFLLMVVLVYGMHVLHRRAENPLDHLEAFSRTMTGRVSDITNKVNAQVIDLASRFAFFDVIWSTFDRPEGQNTQEQTYDSSTTEQ